ncbi:hypothetical protein HELRODRAFT_186127 [Helobdella robusta]|uniref:Micro-fibrillar-associated protein 1 C-terminal domain-containing protein n=1 Tax=Helobdella robusta TaxID=6412 RepID=T1FNP7_HELRO|nr:hypothetical protein HELRODRAFT_186127 [Helobdella robusta]ESN92455.1 hypothetical protein HELRODRAFT_186127 [Helobdella robusta]
MSSKVPIMSTAGAVPTKNEKGELTMEKVKVSRYVTGKRPEYAPDSSDEEDVNLNLLKIKNANDDNDEDDDDNEYNNYNNRLTDEENVGSQNYKGDKRLQRLMNLNRHRKNVDDDYDDEDRIARHRKLVEPEVLEKSDDDENDYDNDERDERRRYINDGDASDDEDLDDEEIERRREAIRLRILNQKKDEDILDRADESDSGNEKQDGEDDDDDDYEEYSESEEEEVEPRLKPVFVRKKDRITIQEKEKELQKLKDQEYENKKLANERRAQTLKMVEAEIKRDMETKVKENEDEFGGVVSNDENDEEQYEAWKVRELRRLKRDRDEREAIDREKQELERLHNMTEEERRQEQKLNPKVVTNKAPKGKYKFLQKYYHRGVFYLDKDDTVYKRDFTAPTLEDHFNKTVLPKVMQVKNFGRSGRTKYTHLVDQDTTQFESAWVADTAMNLKFHTNKGGGMKQQFDRPAIKRK